MAKVQHVKRAQASSKPRICRRCKHVIEVGESYYHISHRMGRSSIKKFFCKDHPPRPSETTASDKLASLYAAQEAFADRIDDLTNLQDIADAVRDTIQAAEDVGQEYQDAKDN